MAFTKCDCLILYKGANNADRRLLVRCKGGEMPRQPELRRYAYTQTSTGRHETTPREALRNRKDKYCRINAATGKEILTKAVIRPQA